MEYVFPVLALAVLAAGTWLIVSAVFQYARRKIPASQALKRLLAGLIGAPVLMFAFLLVGFALYPPDPDAAQQRSEERAAAAAERAAADQERREQEAARRQADRERQAEERAQEAADREREEHERAAAESAAAAQAEADCRQTLQCWGERHHVAASVRCRRPVERLANYTMEWTDGFLESKFSHFRWSPLGDGILVYIGDTARFQNGFGAWQNVIYECTYDPASERVLDAAARPGRL